MTITIRARFDGRVFVPLQPVDLPIGVEFEVEVRPAALESGDDAPLGSATRILRALASTPPLSREAGDELERSLAEAKELSRESRPAANVA